MRLFFLLFLVGSVASAFPPAPPSTIFGKIRGEYGYSPADGETKLLLLANGEAVATATLSEAGKFGENYRMTLPLDLNPADGVYRTAAITPGLAVTYSFVAERNGLRLPVSKVETASATPEAAGLQRIDFIIGEDSDADGLPDEWEIFQSTALAHDIEDPLSLFSATGDQDGDGMSDHAEYVAGTFAALFEDGFNFQVVKVNEDGSSELRFFAIDGKSYRFDCSTDLRTWTPVVFTLPTAPDTERILLKSENTIVQSIVTDPAPEGAKVMYRLHVD